MDDNKTEGKVDEGKGRVKEAAGSLTDDDSLKNEGKVDKAAGKTKQKLGDAGEGRRCGERRRRQGQEGPLNLVTTAGRSSRPAVARGLLAWPDADFHRCNVRILGALPPDRPR